MNVMIPFVIIAAITTYAWPFARTEASLIIIAIIYGFALGAYISLIINPIVAMGSTGHVGHRVGVAMTVLGLGALVGPPISGAINRVTHGFPAVGYYAGSMVILGVILMLITRHMMLGGRFWGKF
ncbi:hypothetical protein M422DRAFT_60167 [Sphaerobolus stellatus SS14]|uniref:Major facilitator superfamily (MFS) profile domain-containing protein n=1 Tax=Sphaerobolus stellatus (strain SS14) TaxID=990650 RepID=A0A0C9VYC3_SPHS4|nr:hypothetical protein M422DRAFT_60167 [Sphaerobolus stellatus SS14]